jgi:hypothetical protein
MVRRQSDTQGPGVARTMLVAVPMALAASGGAALVVGVLALPVALVLTRDAYLTLLASSYGPFAAAETLVALIFAALAWAGALLVPLPTVPRVLAGGAVAGMLGLLLGAVPYLAVLPVPWHYGPALPITPLDLAMSALLGLAAGGIFLYATGRLRPPPGNGWRCAIWQSAWFVGPLALLLAGWAAILSALGLI